MNRGRTTAIHDHVISDRGRAIGPVDRVGLPQPLPDSKSMQCNTPSLRSMTTGELHRLISRIVEVHRAENVAACIVGPSRVAGFAIKRVDYPCGRSMNTVARKHAIGASSRSSIAEPSSFDVRNSCFTHRSCH